MLTDTQKKQQKQLILLSVIILAIIAIILFSRKDTPANIPTEITNENTNLDLNVPVSIEKIQENSLGILSSKAFEGLNKNGQYPVEAGKTGRINPFIPYEEGPFNE